MRIYEMITQENTLIIIKFVYWSVWSILCVNLWKWSPKWNTLSFCQIYSTKECIVVSLENLFVDIYEMIT